MVIEHNRKDDGLKLIYRANTSSQCSRKLGSFCFVPIEHDDIWAMYKQHAASFWATEEIDLAEDMKDWEQLNKDEQHFLKHVLHSLLRVMVSSTKILCEFFDEVCWAELEHSMVSKS